MRGELNGEPTMNDFTKEELIEISLALDLLPMKWNGFDKRWKSDLQIKLQSLIDNYCEHDPEGDNGLGSTLDIV